MPTEAQLLRSVRLWLAIFIVGLVLSGVTAFPLVHETAFLVRTAEAIHLGEHAPALMAWLQRVHTALAETDARYPFLAYGTDWLAFGHLVIATAFLGPWLDPLRNRWVITYGLIACLGVLPLAFIAGPIREIPPYWRCIDASFGVFGSLPLWIVRHRTRQIESLQRASG